MEKEIKDKKDSREKKVKSNRFIYDSDLGLKVINKENESSTGLEIVNKNKKNESI